MVRTSNWPDVDRFTDHWSWRPDWTPERPRVLWYLTFEGVPDVRRLAEPTAEPLRAAGADIVPARWLHLTVSDAGFAEEIDRSAHAAAAAVARGLLGGGPPLDLTLGPVAVLPGAVVLPARPRRPLVRIRDAARRATASAGIDPPDDLEGDYWPHVSLGYVNRGTDHEALRAAVRSAGPGTVNARCDRLAQVLVTRRNGHYRWEVLDEVRLGEQPAEQAPGTDRGRAH